MTGRAGTIAPPLASRLTEQGPDYSYENMLVNAADARSCPTAGGSGRQRPCEICFRPLAGNGMEIVTCESRGSQFWVLVTTHRMVGGGAEGQMGGCYQPR